MNNEIVPIPRLPDNIINAVNDDTLAVFIGAGVSRLVGCVGWAELASQLLQRCHSYGIINFKEQKTLELIKEHKKTITICYHLFKNRSQENLFFENMKKSLKEGSKEIPYPNIYDDIIKLRGLFITTNADTHFDRFFNRPNVLYEVKDFTADKIDRNNLYHIHGSIDQTSSLVFTVRDYMKRYTQNNNFKLFLDHIFRNYTVLFLGYGLAEFEILEFILRGNNESNEDEPRVEPKHYMLDPFYKGENNILRYEQAYYNDLGINILAYEKDMNGYHQLSNVICKWSQEINQVTNYLHDAARIIDKAVE